MIPSDDHVPVTRYDLVLAAIPSAFVAAVLAAHLLSVPVQTALTGASAVGALALIDALFLNPPGGRTGRPG